MAMEDARANKLARFLDDVLSERRPLRTIKDSTLFVEAICAQPDQPTCINKLISSRNGLSLMQDCMRYNTSPEVLNGQANSLLKYIQDPRLKTICEGDFLRRILLCVVEPPIFWNPFVEAFKDDNLELSAQQSFAWLLFELISLPDGKATEYLSLAQDPMIQSRLLNSGEVGIRVLGQKIKNITTTMASTAKFNSDDHPGGRHDNDFRDFRQISILPTADELKSEEPPFLRLAQSIEEFDHEETSRLALHLDNQFRLLREDMLGEIREELQIALGKKKGRHRGKNVTGFTPVSVYCEHGGKYQQWGMQLKCHFTFDQLFGVKVESKDRKAYLDANRNVFKHQSLACFLVDGEVVAFPTINRVEDLLLQDHPIVVLQFSGETSTSKTLLKMKAAQSIRLVQINTAVFSYEPVLQQLQAMRGLPLSDEIFWTQGCPLRQPPSMPAQIVQAIESNPSQDLKSLLNTGISVKLDASQSASLLMGLTQRLSLIQGPPGTGKSFIGALIAKILHDYTSEKILVVCYTNHALDQFLEDLLDIGIPAESMVRIGGKSTPRTKPLALFGHPRTFKQTRDSWKIIDELKGKASGLAAKLTQLFGAYHALPVQKRQLMEYLEFSTDDLGFYEAFTVPEASDGTTTVGKRGRGVNKFYLLDQWIRGRDAGAFAATVSEDSLKVWQMPILARQAALERWRLEVLKEQVSEIYSIADQYNQCQEKLERMLNANNAHILGEKRIIAGTTTGAAKYVKEVQSTPPGVLLVEEASEILESHILTSLGIETKHLVLIGDHKQLRPKVANYNLSVEKGEGYDLNRSLFERLVLKGYPHQTLSQQHRMRPEISMLVRELTYPDLVDAPKTKNRPDIRGFQANVVFVNHSHPEDDNAQLASQKDPRGPSKQNRFEAEMVLKCVRYLGQNGYGTDKIVILTPYLAQLHLLRDILSKENDPILNDLDSYDLVRAGLMSGAQAKLTKRPLRISSIDNYQGEESDIAIISMTRSNDSHDIGFMAAPERLNVLLSRARNALIMIGNAETFLNARKGKDMWIKFFNLLRLKKYIFDGFPVKCERHPDRKAVLCRAADFDEECPDGGCKEPCGSILACGIHPCRQRCHQIYDHSKMQCEKVLEYRCPKSHTQVFKCFRGPPLSCRACRSDDQLNEQKQKRAFELQQKRDQEQREHEKAIASLDEKLDLQRQELRDAQMRKEREQALRQKEKDLAGAIALASRAAAMRLSSPDPPDTKTHSNESSTAPQPISSSPLSWLTNKLRGTSETPQDQRKKPEEVQLTSLQPKSVSETEWQRQKDMENARNDAIDSIMEMVGLEEVKSQVLRIKAKIDITLRQGTDMKDERFGIVLQGNPGTGKTTVARQYAKFLTSMGILPGSAFIETTGSRLADDGVPGTKKLIEETHNAGGGALFVDEAYQLTEKQSFGGGQVLDFLLAEIENNVGKIVFILAGYNKQMEKFFEHNPGLLSRIPYTLQFADYTDSELQQMLRKLITKKYNGKMTIEDGMDGLYVRIAVRRLGRGRGREGFGNARGLQNVFSKISERQAERIERERRNGQSPDDFHLKKEDLIGPDPSEAIIESSAWRKLQELIGLETVKDSVRNMIDRIGANYRRELQEKPPIEVSLNRVFLGSPGTGKTSVAKLYGRILADIGLLSSGEVVEKNPADFIGSALGQSESNTKAILATTVGKVLIIDEAYMLYSGSGGTGAAGNQSDIYKTAVIDTIVAEVQSTLGEDRCVLLLGYQEQIREMFDNVNPGLARRFAIDDAFHFQDFTGPQLREILELKLKHQGLDATEEAKSVALEVLSRARRRPNFGNGGEVENILSKAKSNHQARQSSIPVSERPLETVFEPQDFDVNFDRGEKAVTNCRKLFEDVVGCEEIVEKLEGYQQIALNMKSRGLDITEGLIPTNFIFKGPPGTGKTTTARKMGQIYYDMGFLSVPEVVECSASDLIAQFVGQTGPKTRKQLEKGLGKVLFIDEAYRLGEGNFATEAVNELVDLLTKPQFMGKIVVILAGYDEDMNRLMEVNSGLTSRFPETVSFHDMAPEQCLRLLIRELQKKDIAITTLLEPGSDPHLQALNLLEELSSLPSWGNARDVQTIAKKMIGFVFKTIGAPDDPLALAGEEAIRCLETVLAERRSRSSNSQLENPTHPPNNPVQMLHPQPPEQPVTTTKQVVEKEKLSPKREKKDQIPKKESDSRDPGVPDSVWNQLQANRIAEENARKRTDQEMRNLAKKLRETQALEAAQAREREKLAQAKAKDEAERNELKRRQEAARLEEQRARVARQKALLALKKAREEEKKRKEQEARVQAKLRDMGVCVAGFRWINEGTGYRCAGGSHFISNGQLGV